MVQIPKELRKKWDPKSQKLLFMGYCEGTKGYKLINPVDKKIFFNRDVRFLEKDKHDSNKKKRKDPTSETGIQLVDTEENEKGEDISEDEIVTEEDNSDEIFESLKSEEEVQEPLRRSQREKKPMVRSEYITYYARSEEQGSESMSAEEALSRPDSQG